MKRFLFLAFLVLAVQAGYAQSELNLKDTVIKKAAKTENTDTVAWLHGATFNLGANQGFIHNWAAGGEIASVAVNGFASMYLSRLYRRHIWNNNLYMNYGLFYANSNNFEPRKTDDRIDFTSKYGYRIDTAKDFYLTALFNVITQFTKGYDYELPHWDTAPTSDFLSPAYVTFGLGMEYRKGSNFNMFLSPVAARLTYADKYYTQQYPEGAFGIKYDETTRLELGAYFTGIYKIDFNEKNFYRVRLTLYSNYLAEDKTDSLGNVVKTDNPGNIDIIWDNQLSLSVAKNLNLLFSMMMIYDNDIPYEKTYIDETGTEVPKKEPGSEFGWWQVKQNMTIGLQYEF